MFVAIYRLFQPRVPADEFMKKILDGERDFRGIVLAPSEDTRTDVVDSGRGFEIDLTKSELFNALNKYLRSHEQELSYDPLNVSGSAIERTIAHGIYLPYLKGERASFYRSDFEGAALHHAYIPYVNANYSIFNRADLSFAVAPHAKFRKSKLVGANFYGAKMPHSDFREIEGQFSIFDYADVEGSPFVNSNLDFAEFLGTYMPDTKIDKAYLIMTEFTSNSAERAGIDIKEHPVIINGKIVSLN